MEIRDSVAIVTGSSRGIGLAIASMLAEAGGRVAINASKESDTLHRVAKALGTDEQVIAAPGDVGDFEACRKIVDTTLNRFGRVDILVNNAGIFGLKRTVEMEPRDWETIFRVHVFGAFNMIRHVLPRMTKQKRGVIVNIASFVALRPPGPGRVHYASAKAALLGLTRALGLEVASDGVRVVGIAPGLTDTEIVRQGVPNLTERTSRVPLGRMARPEEIAHTVRYAIENEFLTAETVYVTGGE
ncbi:MAG TPA: SDR family oxidoreductase [Thermoplasmata archaeon]|nr:SDR family oxidoreductase [Thermoplasmata archaeon]